MAWHSRVAQHFLVNLLGVFLSASPGCVRAQSAADCEAGRGRLQGYEAQLAQWRNVRGSMPVPQSQIDALQQTISAGWQELAQRCPQSGAAGSGASDPTLDRLKHDRDRAAAAVQAEQIRQEEDRRRATTQAGVSAQRSAGSQPAGDPGNPFAPTSGAAGDPGNPFAAGKSAGGGEGDAPAQNPFAQPSKAMDPEVDYTGEPCAFFTRENDAAHIYTYADGSSVCYGKRMYVCEGQRWRSRGLCNSFQGWRQRRAEDLER